MAVATLSPWPTTPAALTAAADCLAAELPENLSQARVQALGETAAALVERHAPDAPASIKREAVIRCAGWLAEAPAGGERSESTGDVRTSFSPGMTGALRHSGAMGLLSPWKVRRAGAIG